MIPSNIKDYHSGIVNKLFSVREAVESFLNKIKKEDENINAFLSVFENDAIKRAEELDDFDFADKEKNILFGVPMAIKDNILISGFRATAASKILENYIASYDATVIKKLKNANAVFLGKTNLDEFAMGSSTEYSAFKITKNPYDLEKVPGGSSGGSAAAVASGMVIASLGSDTGGSIRQPASFCGIVGLKPTYGAVSRYGVMALASSLDQIGPFANTVEDVAAVFKAISGQDEFDSTGVKNDYSDVDNFENVDVKKFTIGIPEEYFIDGTSKEVKDAINNAIKLFENDGFKIKKISLPHTSYATACYYIILPAECSANLGRYDGIRYSPLEHLKNTDIDLLNYYLQNRGEGIGEEPQRRILLGTFVLSAGYYDAYYSKAQKVRRLILNDFLDAFDKNKNGVDTILTPVSPTTAFKIGEKKDNPLAMYLSDIFTIPTNLAGLPALSLPVSKGYNKEKMPINFQIIGKHFCEKNILALGHYYEHNLRR